MLDRAVDSGSVGTSAANWDTCIAAARQGDRDALGHIFDRVAASLCSSAREQLDARLRVKASPSDVVQETLLEAHRSFGTFQGATRSELLFWIRGILNHRVQTAHRRYRCTSKRNIAREIQLQSLNESEQRFLFAGPGSSPSSYAVANEEWQRLAIALKELPQRYEQVIRLRNELKLSFAEVATALDCSADAAQKLWTRAINRLAQNLDSVRQSRGYE